MVNSGPGRVQQIAKGLSSSAASTAMPGTSTTGPRELRDRSRTRKVVEKEAYELTETQEAIIAAVETHFKPALKTLTREVARLTAALEEQIQQNKELESNYEALKDSYETLKDSFTGQIEGLKVELTASINTQLSNVYIPVSASASASAPALAPASYSSYAAVARSPPSSQPSNLASIPMSRMSAISEALYCTIDTSKAVENGQETVQVGPIRAAIEKEVQVMKGQGNWRCAAVTRDPRNTTRIRITCRDEEELQSVKKAAEKTAVVGTQVLRDQLFPIKVDSVNRFAVLNEYDQLFLKIAEKLGKENNVHIAKIAWLSKKDNAKAYRLMVVYITRGSDARRLLQEQYFHVAGESAFTSLFEPRTGPIQCYKCQEIGHKAFNCRKPQTCGICAREGHHHSECTNNTTPKCVPCGGPHESFSKHCRVLYLQLNE